MSRPKLFYFGPRISVPKPAFSNPFTKWKPGQKVHQCKELKKSSICLLGQTRNVEVSLTSPSPSSSVILKGDLCYPFNCHLHKYNIIQLLSAISL